MMRPTWDETWMGVATYISLRSLCSRRKIGAVIVDKHNRIVSTGYNSPPAGFARSGDGYCQNYCPRAQKEDNGLSYESCVSIHAEANALMFADRRDYEGGTLYVTSACCWDCGKMVANSGVARVVVTVNMALDAHRDPMRTIKFMRDCGIEVEVWD